MEEKLIGENSCMFLLRCWQESDPVSGHPVWRFSLVEAAGEQHRRGFTNLEAAMNFIGDELDRLSR